ncbi:MAG: sigma-70 family RNA polymerase sigma factor [Bacteroidales bacterium]
MVYDNHLSSNEITQYLQDYDNGDKKALDKLFPLIYNELRKGAKQLRFQFFDMDTMNTTALVHEAYLKLIQSGKTDFKNRSHFFFIASRAMRQILVNASLRKRALKRGGNNHDLSIDDMENKFELSDKTAEDLLMLNDALKKLEIQDERQASIVECRFFGGMTIEETAATLDISPASVKRSWSMAKAWLYLELNEQ